MAKKWKGTPVPKYGAIEKIYLNTKLSTEDVNIELSKLASSGYDQHYLIYDNSENKYRSILECSISPYYMRIMYKDPDGGNTIDLFTSDEGWKIDYDVIYLNLNEAYYNGQSPDLSTPDLISSVISITPFEEEEVIYEGTPVPTEGSLEAVYFNNNMCFEDIIKTLESMPCNISNMPYFVYRSSALTEQDIPEQYVAIFKVEGITTIEMRVRIKEYTQYIMRIFASEFVDGNEYGTSIFGEQLDNYLRHCHKGFSIFNKYVGPDCDRNSDMGDSYTGGVTMYNNVLSPEEFQGAPVGIYNDLLSSLISATPFKKIVLEPKKNEEPSNNESKEFKTPTTIIKNPHFFLKSSGSGGGLKALFDFTKFAAVFGNYAGYEDDEGNWVGVLDNVESIPDGLLSYDDTENVLDMSYMFSDCYSLTTVPELNTSNVYNMNCMFYNCESLVTVPAFDTSNVWNLDSMFYECSSLKSILMYGMKVSFDISASTQFEREDLVVILNNLATITDSQTLTMGSDNLAKLTDEDKAIATNKGWTLA